MSKLSISTEVVIINRTEDASFEEDLAADVLEIITVFSARLYGSRSHKNKKIYLQINSIPRSSKICSDLIVVEMVLKTRARQCRTLIAQISLLSKHGIAMS